MWDRMVLVPFTQRIRGQQKEVLDYDKVLCREMPGILNYALAGLAKLRRLGRFPEPELCRQAKAEHRERCDTELSWLKDNMCQESGAYTELKAAYKAYREYLMENGMHQRTCQTFQDAVWRVYGVKAQPVSKYDRRRLLKGLRLLGETSGPVNEEDL